MVHFTSVIKTGRIGTDRGRVRMGRYVRSGWVRTGRWVRRDRLARVDRLDGTGLDGTG
jgi:hypothetical protein